MLIALIALALVQTVGGTDARGQWEVIGRAAPRAMGLALAQAAVGFAAALCIHRLLGRAGLWLAVMALGAGVYAAALHWRWIERSEAAPLWLWVPCLALLALAALDAIPAVLREAAAVDRAGPWFSFRMITLPLVAPVMLGGVAFRIADSFRPTDAPRFIAAHLLLIGAIVVGSLAGRSRP